MTIQNFNVTIRKNLLERVFCEQKIYSRNVGGGNVIFAFIGGALGSILTYLLYGYGMGEGISAPFARTLLANGTLNIFWAQMISDVTIDLVDKAITVVLAFAIIKLIPDRLKPGLRLTGWRQAPLSREALYESKKNVTRSWSLRSKIVVIISAIMVCVAVVTTVISYILYNNFAMRQYTYSCTSAARLSAGCLDPEKVDDYLKMDPSSAEYRAIESRLGNIRAGNPDVEYIYVYKFMEEGVHVVFDLDTVDVKGQEPGTVIEYEEYLQPYKDDLLAGKPIEPLLDDTIYGRLLTVFEPVYDPDGGCVCYAAADIVLRIQNGLNIFIHVVAEILSNC